MYKMDFSFLVKHLQKIVITMYICLGVICLISEGTYDLNKYCTFVLVFKPNFAVSVRYPFNVLASTKKCCGFR